MDTRYINENRYKKVARNDRKKRTVARGKKKPNVKVPISNNRLPNDSTKKTRFTKKSKMLRKMWKIILCTLLILAIATISRLILKDEESPFIPNIFEKEIVNAKTLRVGIVENNLNNKYINNVTVQELDSYAYPMLIKIGKNYKIEYNLVNGIDKISNKEYILSLDDAYGITASQVKSQLEEYMSKNNMYYPRFSNVNKIEVNGNNSVTILLKQDDEYFVYNLSVPVYFNTSYNINYNLTSKTENKRVYTRRETADTKLIQNITLITIKSLDDAVAKYKAGQIDMFFANSNRVMQMLGKYEYNISSYRDGNMLFLLGNNESKIYDKQEIRNAICYGIDRDTILNNVFQYKVAVVDLPYIYDQTKYKYDYIAAENCMLSNKYVKKNNVYSKKENKEKITAELGLLVSKGDKYKIKVANYIKSDLKKIGITINVEQLEASKISERVSKKEYDLVLADISLNNNPNINFLKNNLYLSDNIKKKEEQIITQGAINFDGINELRQTLSNEYSYFGIKANEMLVIYSKGFSDITEVTYMNIFTSLMNKNTIEN